MQIFFFELYVILRIYCLKPGVGNTSEKCLQLSAFVNQMYAKHFALESSVWILVQMIFIVVPLLQEIWPHCIGLIQYNTALLTLK